MVEALTLERAKVDLDGLVLTVRGKESKDYHDAVRAGGITRRIHPLLLRHTFAAVYIRRGGDIFRLSRISSA